ncbi:RNA polymerase III RPC4 family protein [Spironucleus salmonicida]|uniref:RNA polymerase III RPC4 family protein n=1 Tax=Spironucleus salmonicida TaxID=348837 RepID=V6LYF6_9EUKA|nr:RNA polymerase III RPC4 family protein [Spironucleus salmonicida]|eukprot:EST49278.1 RNA polymerase III RPC4 family protein [Spironucleus salmonicida]
MNPYDDENFQPQKQKQMLFMPKQIAKESTQSIDQPSHVAKKRQNPLVFKQVQQIQQVQGPTFTVDQELKEAKLTGNCPQQLPFTNSEQLPLASISTQYTKNYQPQRQVQGQQDIQLKQNMILQFPTFLPYSKSPFISMTNGTAGTLRKHKSGKMSIKLNNGTILRVFPGQTVEMSQQVVLVDKNEHIVQKVCDVQGKLVCSVEF